MKFIVQALLVLGLFSPCLSLAQIQPSFGDPRVVPPIAAAGQPITLVLTRVLCGPFGAPVISVSNFVVNVTQAVPPACSGSAGAGELEFPLGSFPPGTYTLVYQPTNILGTGGSWPSQSTQFTVQAPTAVPVNAVWAQLLLASSLLVAGVAARSRRIRGAKALCSPPSAKP